MGPVHQEDSTQPMTASNSIPDPAREESQEPLSRTPHPTDPSLAPAGAPQKQERDYLVIGLIIALMAMIVAGFFALDGRIDTLSTRIDTLSTRMDTLSARMDSLETSLSARIDTLSTRMDSLSARMDSLETSLNARIDGLYELVLPLKK